jgi:hypothetical protein
VYGGIPSIGGDGCEPCCVLVKRMRVWLAVLMLLVQPVCGGWFLLAVDSMLF